MLRLVARLAPLLLLIGCFPKEAPLGELEWPLDPEGTAERDLSEAPPSCPNHRTLEPTAMLGRLDGAGLACIHDALRHSTHQPQRRKLSLMLVADAWAKGDRERWEAAVLWHLTEVDASDPDLVYKYALYLAQKDTAHSDAAIEWADVALSQAHKWKGETHKSRVYALYRLRARAAMKKWTALEAAYADDRAQRLQVEAAQERTQVYSKQWLQYADDNLEPDTSIPCLTGHRCASDTELDLHEEPHQLQIFTEDPE